MRAGWRIAINSLSAKFGRTSLLVIAVALATGFVMTTSITIDSLASSLRLAIVEMLGRSDLRVRHRTQGRLDQSHLDLVSAWPEVRLVGPRLTANVVVINDETGEEIVATAHGIDLDVEWEIRPLEMSEGQPPTSPDHIAIDPRVARMLNVGEGDTLTLESFGPSRTFTVCGVNERVSLAILQQAEVRIALDVMHTLVDEPGKLSEIDLVLEGGNNPETVLERRRSEIEDPAEMVPSDRILAGADKNLRGGDLMSYLAALFAYLAAGFIVLTGMTTAVTERVRELAMLRCIGASRAQVFVSQLWTGAVIGLLGGLAGLPVGGYLTWQLFQFVGPYLRAGMVISDMKVVAAVLGATGAGVIGALLPALAAAKVAPLAALAVRSLPPRPRGVGLTLIVGIVLIVFQVVLLLVPQSEQVAFWGYVVIGIPAMILGWFLIAVPLLLLVSRILSPVLATMLRVPRDMLSGTVTATPYRHGFTAGAFMLGLSGMIAIWANGDSLLSDWVEPIRFPDAFVQSWTGLTDESIELVREQPYVTNACGIARLVVGTGGRQIFGIEGIDPKRTNFIAFDPDPFFAMTNLDWIQGDPEEAQRRLNEGGAALVAREFLVARGIGVGDTITLGTEEEPYDFEVVGVVGSPGLDIATSFFGIQGEFHEQAIHCVFASRDDGERCFGTRAIHLIQFDLTDDITDEEAEAKLKDLLGPIRFGSGRMIQSFLLETASQMLRVAILIAISSLVIAGLGMANVIAANIAARQFEFGVLRAVGAARGMLVRLILAEALIIAVTAAIGGILLGYNGAWNGAYIDRKLVGLDITPKLLPEAMLLGCVVVTAIALLAATPTAIRLARKSVTQLLSRSADSGS